MLWSNSTEGFWAILSDPWRSYCHFNICPNDLELASHVVLGSWIIFTKFELSQAIRSWLVLLFCCRYIVMLWPWDLTLNLESLRYIVCHVVIVCSEFEWNRTIPSWVINNLANFCPHCITLWHCPLTPWPWTFVVDWVSCVQTVYQIWARSINPWLSYWFATAFLLVFKGPNVSFEKGVDRSAPNLMGDIMQSSLHTKLNNGADISRRFETTTAKSWELLSSKAEDRTPKIAPWPNMYTFDHWRVSVARFVKAKFWGKKYDSVYQGPTYLSGGLKLCKLGFYLPWQSDKTYYFLLGYLHVVSTHSAWC